MGASPPLTVRMDSQSVDVPLELFEAMGSPRAVNVSPVEKETFFIHAAEPRWQKRPWLWKRSLRRWWGPPAQGIVAAYPRPENAHVKLKLLDRPSYLRQFALHGEFRIVNYHPMYYLMPAESCAADRSHDAFWQRIPGYHEHLDVSSQEPQTHRVSEWLASLLAATGAKKVLELGCGAGRNLCYLRKAMPTARLLGLEINADAADKARRIVGDDCVRVGSVHDPAAWHDLEADVILTSGFLMHLPPSNVADVVRATHARARLAVFHFELHGPAHAFDYHRYPRDYAKLYEELNLGEAVRYEIFPTTDYRSAGLGHFNHALLVARKACLSRLASSLA
ncbi:MAG TPA: methyltransferase [Gemmataceae bacterium]|nr:methyltransferase [Gemmataceae bacterium]